MARRACNQVVCKAHYRSNRQTYLARSAKARLDHPQRNRQWKTSWAEQHRDYYSEYGRMWRQRHPEKGVMYAQARRARKRNQFVEHIDPQVVYQMYGGMCGICKQFIDGNFHVDHVVPLSKGGLHGYINCQPAHPRCNLQKGSHHDG